MLVGEVAVALDQMVEQVLVRVHVAVEIHADEAVKLQEPGIDVAHQAGMRKRHLGDDVAAEPVDALFRGEVVHRGRIAAGVDRSAHQRHRHRHERIGVGFHHGNGGEHRHGWLANRNHMHVAAQLMQHFDDVIDIVVEIEAAFGDRHHAGVGPVGDVDLVGRQEGLDGAAQQRGVVAGHRCHDQHARLRMLQRPRMVAVEIQQPAERLLPDRADHHRRSHAVDLGIVEAPFRLAVAARGALEYLAAGGDLLAEIGMRQRVERVLEQHLGGIGQHPRRIQRGAGHLVHPVHRRGQRRANFRRQGRRPAKFTDRHLNSQRCCCAGVWPLHKKASMQGTWIVIQMPAKPAISARNEGYSPPDTSEPARRALRSSPRKLANDAINSTALIASAVTIRSVRKV